MKYNFVAQVLTKLKTQKTGFYELQFLKISVSFFYIFKWIIFSFSVSQ